MTPADKDWYHAFEWWYEMGELDHVAELLREGVTPTRAAAAFLADLLEKKVERPKGKNEPRYRAKKLHADEEMRRLVEQGYSEDAIRGHVLQQELSEDARRFTPKALHERLKHLELPTAISDFPSVYERHTGLTIA